MGFYPVLPGDNSYIFGLPTFSKMKLNLENGNSFSITFSNNSKENKYISGIGYFLQNGDETNILNGKNFIENNLIMSGGRINYTMGKTPGFKLISTLKNYSVTDNLIVINPTINGGGITFDNSKRISISSPQKNITTFYTLDGTEPSIKSKKYSLPFTIQKSTTVKAITVDENGKQSFITTANYKKRQNSWSIKLLTPFEPQYDGGGTNALLDGINGDVNWRKGNWQGYQNNNMDLLIDLKKPTIINEVSTNFLQDVGAWIIYPKQIIVSISTDGQLFTQVGKIENNLLETDKEVTTKNFVFKFIAQARFVKVQAIQYGTLPVWHLGVGGQSHIFVDEIEIK
jgi:hypothetical protein